MSKNELNKEQRAVLAQLLKESNHIFKKFRKEFEERGFKILGIGNKMRPVIIGPKVTWALYYDYPAPQGGKPTTGGMRFGYNLSSQKYFSSAGNKTIETEDIHEFLRFLRRCLLEFIRPK